MKRILITMAATLAATSLPILAADPSGHGGHMMGSGSMMDMGTGKTGPAIEFTRGEVRKIDKEAGKVTLKHGAIVNLDMPPMTMVFKAKDPAILDQVKVGDAVSFRAEKVEGVFIVTELRPAS